MKEKLKKLKRDIPALYIAVRHRQTPAAAKFTGMLAVMYALSPVDLIPDFIPVLGYLDDLLILPLLVYITLKLIPENVMAECRAQAEGMWKDGRPEKWYYALPVAGVWLIAIILVVKAFLK